MTADTSALAILEQIKQSFIEGVPEKLDEMESYILSISKAESLRENFESLYRSIHSLKGSGGSYGYMPITTICHQFEDLLNQASENNTLSEQKFINAAMQHNDLLRGLIENIDDEFAIQKQLSELKKLNIQYFGIEKKAIIVETSRLYREIYSQILTEHHYHITHTDNGYQALERLLTQPYNLLIASYETKLLNGLALIKALRYSKNENNKIKVVLISSKPMNEEDLKDIDFHFQKNQMITDNLSNAVK